MDLFVSKKEIERIIKEYEDLISLKTYLGYKEQILTELVSIKAYNLIKSDFNLTNKYINRVCSLSSLCPAINLADYSIEDVDILIIAKNNILSGFISSKVYNSKDAFINIVKISNNLILSEQDNHYYDENSTLLRLPIIKDLLSLSNISCILSLCLIAEKKINERFNSEFESKLSHHIFIASELRKEDFFKLPINERNRLLKINIKENYSIGEYINFKCKSSILDSLNNLITNLLNEIKKDISTDIFDMDYMWQQISSFIDQLIVNFLDSPIKNSQLKNSPCLFIDLMLVKDEINFLNKIKNDKLIRQKLVQSKIDKLNTIFKEINNEILSVYNQDVQKTFRIIHSGETEAHCRYYSLAKRHLNLDDDDYMVNCLCFIEITGYAFDLDNPLYLTNTLNLKISYRNKIIYSISEDHRNRLLEAQKDILSIIDINKNYRYIG